MTRLLLTLLCAIAATCAAWAQAEVVWPLGTTLDLGTARDTVKVLYGRLPLVNQGDSSLVIVNTQSSCGCTVATYTSQPIAPGDTGWINIAYDVRSIPGPISKKVLVYTNGHPRRSAIKVAGKVIGSPQNVTDHYPVAIGPVSLSHSILPLGETYQGHGVNAYFSGYNTASDTVQVAASQVPDGLAVNVLPQQVEPGGTFIVSAYYAAGTHSQWGLNQEQFVLEAAPLHTPSSTVAGMGRLTVTATVKEDFSKLTDKQRAKAPVALLSGDKADFGQYDSAGTASLQQQFTITNAGKQPLEIRRLQTSADGVGATASATRIKPGKSAAVTVTVAPTLLQGKPLLNETLTVITNDPSQPVQLVRLVGYAKN